MTLSLIFFLKQGVKSLQTPSLLLLSLCFCFFAKASNDGRKTPADSMVQGIVMNVLTKKPLGDVVVSLIGKQQGRREIKSDPSGFFAFSQLPPGEFTLLFSKDGYKTYKKEFTMTREGLMMKLSLEEDDDDNGIDLWNPFRVFYGNR